MRLRLATLLLSLGFLAACESTRFEAPPVPASRNDEALFGRWIAVGDPDSSPGIELRIEPRSRDRQEAESIIESSNPEVFLTFVEHKNEGPVAGEPTPLRVGRDRSRTYLWVDANWAEARMGQVPRADKGDVFVFRYRVRGDVLEIWQASTKTAAHRVIDGVLKGEVHQADNELHVRLKGPVPPQALRKRGFWNKSVQTFWRFPADAKVE